MYRTMQAALLKINYSFRFLPLQLNACVSQRVNAICYFLRGFLNYCSFLMSLSLRKFGPCVIASFLILCQRLLFADHYFKVSLGRLWD
jgi:hypothetical protein